MPVDKEKSESELIAGVQLVEIESHIDQRGSLSALEFQPKLGFLPKRFFYLRQISEGSIRGDHAHKECLQFLVALQGNVSVQFDDGRSSSSVHLGKGNLGVLVQSMIWTKLSEFSPDALILVLASHDYDENDYLRDYLEFKASVNG